MLGPVLSLEEITLEISDEEGEPRRLLDAVSLQMRRGQFVGVIGPSGCGKSTLLKIIAGLTDPTEGTVRWDGRDLATEGDLPPAELGYVPQFSLAHELLTVRECVDYAARLRVDGPDPGQRAERVDALLATVGLDTLADRQVRVLSGGQRRRLSLAIETVSSPSLLLCDEVTSGLDPGSAHEIMKLMHSLSRADGGGRRVVVNVTHSLADMELYDRVIVLTGGCLAFDARPEDMAHYFRVETPEAVYGRLNTRKPGQWLTSWLKHGPYYYGLEAERLLAAPAESEVETAARKEKGLAAVAAWAGTGTGSGPSATLGGTDIDEKVRPDESDGIPKAPETRETPETLEAEEGKPAVSTPGGLAQFAVVLERRVRLFVRDRTQVALQAALIFGFPCLVVIFAWRGLPGIRNLSMDNGQNIVDQLRDATDYLKQAFEVGGLVSGLLLFQIILLALMGSNNGALEVAGERLLLESEKLAGLSSGSYVAAKGVFLAALVTAQAAWMAIFVHAVCGFPGDLLGQTALLWLADAALTAVCLAFSSLARTPSQASLISIYFVGFQLPLSGAVLALPDTVARLTRPFIAAYWSWSGTIQTMRETRFYDLILTTTKTDLAAVPTCVWVLAAQVALGMGVAYLGCRRSAWE